MTSEAPDFSFSSFSSFPSFSSLPKTYDFKATEERLYAWWESSGWFKPENAPQPDGEPFVISIPPPNVTGELHQGHALFVTLEDLMIRYARMSGKAALWVPGTDHAGIATQLQVERKLRSEGTSRQEIGRQRFVQACWDWKAKYHGRITGQLRRLGASCDWERERFTMDEGLNAAVREAFVRLYRMGLIYQAEYLVNWSPGLQTAVSDVEVEYSEEQGTLYYFKYPIADAHLDDGPGIGYIPVATTRPETILGDSAVAVHPEDERYRHLIGATCLVPMLKRTIPVIHDTYVDREFGTGALKITPGHDVNDFNIGQRHGLQIINVMNRDATLNENGGPYAGLDRFECRKRLWADMQAAGLTIKAEPYTMQVPRSQRGGEVIEPLVSKQWFVNTRAMAELSLAAVRSGRIQIVPERFNKVFYHWMENLRPWCISRQLWWGHRIPIWYGPDGQPFCARDAQGAAALARRHYGYPVDLTQDEDVLDTWFSSGLWPFSTLGWPADTDDLRRFYPTAVLETGYDILFFWVARMMMMGLLLTNEVPFTTVYLHGLVRDEIGRKMSKTFGNVIDPIEVMDEMGTDALRFTLLTASSPGNDMNLSIERVRGNRNFANKIWNAARFVLSNLERLPASALSVAPQTTLAQRWIRGRLQMVVAEATRLFESYQYGEAGRQAYDFLWGDYCDWYIEIAKNELNDPATALSAGRTLLDVLENALRLLHPFIPFVTEEIWQHLRTFSLQQPAFGLTAWPPALIVQAWPQADPAQMDAAAADHFAHLQEVVRAIRNARAEAGVEPGRRVTALLAAGEFNELFSAQRDVLVNLARLQADTLVIAPTLPVPAQAVTLVAGGITCYLPLAGLVDLGAERARLQAELEQVMVNVERVERTLANSGFVSRAPADVVARERARLAELQQQQASLTARLAAWAS
ncbi:MAG: valine--tRNA ligase [Anaerolineae bacterium]